MPSRQPWIRWFVLSTLGLCVVGSGLLSLSRQARPRLSRNIGILMPNAPLPLFAAELKKSDQHALESLGKRLAVLQEGKPAPLDEIEARQWLDVMASLRDGYVKFSPEGKAVAVDCAVRILKKFEGDPAPAIWIEALPMTHELLLSAMGERSPKVNVPAMMWMARLWTWLPGRTLDVREEAILTDWREALYQPVVRCLGYSDPDSRTAAVACLGELPIDDAASIASAYVSDPDPHVRLQTLRSFAKRRGVLSEESILPMIYDSNPHVSSAALETLKDRGLSQELIGLCRLIAHPTAGMRVSAIPLLLKREDVDPLVWLMYLSRDKDESVRIKAIEAFKGKDDVEIRQRLTEMSLSDQSPSVRQAAAKMVEAVKTASLPPLPGSPSLTPKAN